MYRDEPEEEEKTIGTNQKNREVTMGPSIKRRILLIDDEIFNLVSLKFLIGISVKNLGFSEEQAFSLIDFASNGQDAMQKIGKLFDNHNQQYSLIFTDCEMPIMNGYHSSKAIREFYQ